MCVHEYRRVREKPTKISIPFFLHLGFYPQLFLPSSIFPSLTLPPHTSPIRPSLPAILLIPHLPFYFFFFLLLPISSFFPPAPPSPAFFPQHFLRRRPSRTASQVASNAKAAKEPSREAICHAWVAI